jgi:hypothetical protein
MAEPDIVFTHITVTPDIAVRDTSGRAVPPKQPCELFVPPPALPPLPEGDAAAGTDTLIPIAFQIPDLPTSKPVTIAIGVKVQFPKEWDGLQALQLVGALQDVADPTKSTPLLQTLIPWPVVLDKQVPATYLQEKSFEDLQLIAPTSITSPLPFSAAGVWQWSLQVPNPRGEP